jgi:hypothetical protein
MGGSLLGWAATEFKSIKNAAKNPKDFIGGKDSVVYFFYWQFYLWIRN